MPGYLLLQGGGEFQEGMAASDRQALTAAGGKDARVVIIPTAAAPDDNNERAGENGVRWYRHLGGREVEALPLIDKASAGDAAIAEAIEQATLIYLLGGFPGYLAHTLQGSVSWQAMRRAYAAGAVIAGSSAGAMVLCEVYYDPFTRKLTSGLNLLTGISVIPHYNRFGKGWTSILASQSKDIILVGIDELTSLFYSAESADWQLYGEGSVTTHLHGIEKTFMAGEIVREIPVPDFKI